MTRQGAINILVVHAMAGAAELSGGEENLMALASVAVIEAFRVLDITDPELNAAISEANSLFDFGI